MMIGSRDLMHTIKTNKVLDTQDLDKHVLGCNTKPIVIALFLSIEMKIPFKIEHLNTYNISKLN